MHQISLLGLGDVQQHGAASHWLRPDRVYRTSVLSPMVGFNPGQAVQAVASEFTTGPQSGMTLGRAYRPVLLGAPLFPRLSAWWQGVKARAWHRNMAAAAAAAPMGPMPVSDASTPSNGSAFAMPPPNGGDDVAIHQSPYGPAAQMAPWLGPQARGIPGQMVRQSYGQSANFPQAMQDGIDKTTMMMWRGLRWPWH